MSQGFSARPARACDLEAVLGFAKAVPGAPHWDAAVWKRVLELAVEAPASRVVLLGEAAAAGSRLQMVGLAVASCAAGVGELEALVIAPEFRRLGFGRSLCGAAMGWAAAGGATEMQLEVRASNAKAIALYRTLGFVEVGRRARYYREPQEDALLMSVVIAGAASAI